MEGKGILAKEVNVCAKVKVSEGIESSRELALVPFSCRDGGERNGEARSDLTFELGMKITA